ncbi:MAG TPA: DUF4124 domain-containing protein [Burkholderiaceae bacterium]|nr:DUF4124 domain-containing protein [Burkholderiaceae bacterium]
MTTLDKRIAALFLLAIPWLPSACFAEIYGWIDSNGVVTYSNLPPPKGVEVTQVIHEEPLSAKDAAQAAQRAKEAEAAAQNDRMRLREWELSRSQQAAFDYPPAPMPVGAPPDNGCAPYGSQDCDVWYTVWPWGYGYRPRYGWRYGNGFRGPNYGYPVGRGPGQAPAPSHHASAQAGAGSGHAR